MKNSIGGEVRTITEGIPWGPPLFWGRPPDRLSAMVAIRTLYGHHPCGQKFCRKCHWPMIPPSYPGDYWDCYNYDCGNSYPPSKSDTNKMLNRKTSP